MTERETLESFLLSRSLITEGELKLSRIRQRAIEQIEADPSDRAAAIVYAAIIEESLGKFIRRFLVHTPSLDKIAREKFGMSGPLGAFETKIDLGALLGLYEAGAHRTLHTIKDIRNKFAHRLEADSFDSEQVRDLATNLVFPDQFITERDGRYDCVFMLRLTTGGETETLGGIIVH